MKNIIITLGLGFLTAGVSLAALPSAQAAETSVERSTGYVGGMLGANLPNGDSGSSSSPLFGIMAGAKLNPAFGLGVFGTYYGQSNSGSIFGLKAGTETHTWNLCGEANFFASIFRVGADVGSSINTWSAGAGNASIGSSKSFLIYGPEAGLELPLGNSGVSVGGSAHYLFNSADNSQNNLLMMVDLSVWL